MSPTRILCTHPGRYGDCLWALPTVRAISYTHSCPVDLCLSQKYGTPDFAKLLQDQLYIGTVYADQDWLIEETAPITPSEPPHRIQGYDQIVHLGYTGWPQRPLAQEVYRLAAAQITLDHPLDLETPWLAPPLAVTPTRIVVGFSEEHFELKTGLYWLLRQRFGDRAPQYLINLSNGPRWGQLFNWGAAASWIHKAEVFVGCCSGLHVAAAALGTPVVVVEPNPARHHEIFYPLGKANERVTLVLGLDGQPTVDSRHLIDAIEFRLQSEISA